MEKSNLTSETSILPHTLDYSSYYYSVNGLIVKGVSSEEFKCLIQELSTHYYVDQVQVIETAGYSFAMIVRHALGLSAERSLISLIVDDSLQGQVALTAARYLTHAGSICHVAALGEFNSSIGLKNLKSLEQIGNIVTFCKSNQKINSWVETSLQRSEHMLMGVELGGSSLLVESLEIINESICPVHCVQCPTGVNPNTGEATKPALLASSTLSLGAPLNGLSKARDFVGRHYICDISLPTTLVNDLGQVKHLYHDQPVQTLLFEKHNPQ